MVLFLISVVAVAICVLGLCFNIVFRKKDFPCYDVGSNEEMKKLGIRCFKDEDAELHNVKCSGEFSDACKDCMLYESGSDSWPA